MPESVRVAPTNIDAKVEKTVSEDRAPEARPHPSNLHAQLLYHQRTIGNQAVQRLIRSGSLHAPLKIKPPTRRQALERDEGISLHPVHRQTVKENIPNTPLHSDSPANRIPRLATRPGSGISPDSQKPHIHTKHAGGALNIQRAWYNVNIPFTDYQFDPSLEGIKTAANVVKDTAVAGVEWIVDEIKSLVSSGIDWLTDKWNAIQNFASSALDAATKALTNIIGFLTSPLSFLADAIISLDAQSVAKAWATFSGIVSSVSNGFKAMTDGLLQQVNSLWGGINGFTTSLLNKVSGLTENFLFKKLPDALQNIAFTVINKLKSLWASINDGWNKLFNKVKSWIDGAIDRVFSFVRNVLSFGINTVINGIIQFGQLVLFLKDLFSNPQKYVEILAQKSVKALDGVESKFAGEVSKYFGSAKAEPTKTPSTTIHRQPAAGEATETKGSATWGEIGDGVLDMMGKKWKEFKADPWSVIKQLLLDMIFPYIGDIKDIVKLFQNIKKIVTGPLSAGSLEEFWTSLLQILDIPILIYNTIVSILMRTLMLPLIVASFVRHPLVTAIATAVGYGLLGAFLQGEVVNIAHKLLLLKTGATTKAQKGDAYNSVADSLVAMAMAAIAIVIMIILHFIANVIRGVYNFIKGKLFPVEKSAPKLKPDVKDDDVKPGAKPTVIEVDLADLKSSEPSYDSGSWRWNLYDAKSGARFCDVEVKSPSSAGRPPGGPELTLDVKNATLPDGSKVTLKARGFGWTNESLKLSLKAFKEKFGFDAPELSGEIDWDNLANFQNEFDQIRTAQPGLDPQAVGVEAAKRISFGKARIKLGYDQFDVKMSNFDDVTLQYGGEGVKGKTLHNVPKDVRIESRPSGGGAKE